MFLILPAMICFAVELSLWPDDDRMNVVQNGIQEAVMPVWVRQRKSEMGLQNQLSDTKRDDRKRKNYVTSLVTQPLES